MAKTKIEYVNYSWNPIKVKLPDGTIKGWHCTKVSEGCQNCYAERMNMRFGNKIPYDNHYVEFVLDEKILEQPLHWKKPRRIFVQSMGDIFHQDINRHILLKVFHMMFSKPEHNFILLTKRPLNMLQFLFGWKDFYGDLLMPNSLNMWVGTTIENGRCMKERTNILYQIPARVRFLSIEPMLENMALEGINNFKWVIVGAESGIKRRPCKIEWVRSIVNQCKDVGVPVFVKQIHLPGIWTGIRVSKNMAEWPEDLRVREYPDV